MNDYIDVIKKSIELSNVLKEGIDYIKETIVFREYGELDSLVEGIVDSVVYLEKALNPVFLEIKDNEYEKIIKDFKNSLNLLKDTLDNGDMDEAISFIEDNLSVKYKIWKKHLDSKLKKYTYC
ncbi:hypothetical protein AAGC94_16300 [Clostridium sporogenes]|uniref:Dual specificity protein phosphatase family protein n=2 Tax=Clostridium TaxID=1485 RepID=A0A7X5P645_CLOSG|nr:MULTISPECIES: hypothetical protein [Clostridium]AJD30477.1 hypothetical protein T258_1431 [Clostridium botulinum Prevot_594]AVP64015.1 hypothetical protein C3B64_07005 [Clostridium botulinum]EHN13986.1 hypothetical protein IYC_15948 [Clostridium sporogenes PA 3679]KOY65741.1 hypothetical protein AN649_11175 [Clostridium sporogenes]KRU43291.1 hypothetical protein VT94_13690 [Clostridium sporogenes]